MLSEKSKLGNKHRRRRRLGLVHSKSLQKVALGTPGKAAERFDTEPKIWYQKKKPRIYIFKYKMIERELQSRRWFTAYLELLYENQRWFGGCFASLEENADATADCVLLTGAWQQCVGSGGAGSKRLFLCFGPITHLSNPIMPRVRRSQRGVEMPGSSSLNGPVRAEWKCAWFSLHLIWVSVVRVPKPSP